MSLPRLTSEGLRGGRQTDEATSRNPNIFFEVSVWLIQEIASLRSQPRLHSPGQRQLG
jgi:hypothetical protein